MSMRPRRSVLAVPGSSDRFIEKSRTLPVDCLFLDLEDAVANSVKDEARRNVIEALQDSRGWLAPTVTVRINGWASPWTTSDVVELVGEAGQWVDCLVLPKVSSADHVKALDLVLTQVEKQAGLPIGKIGLELQIEDGAGLLNVGTIAAASPRAETLVYGPGDFMAAMGMGTFVVGSQPADYQADAFHHVLMGILTAARAYGLQAIDGPYTGVRDLDGFIESAKRTAALGYDGKWVLHPSQIDAANEIYAPTAADLERAKQIVAAYQESTSESGPEVGAIMVDDLMVDESGMKLAQRILAKGRIAGLVD